MTEFTFPNGTLVEEEPAPEGLGTLWENLFNLNFMTYLTFLNWMPQALKMSESQIISHAGLDSAVFLRIYTLGLKIFVPMTIVALLVLIPVNVSSAAAFLQKYERYWLYLITTILFNVKFLLSNEQIHLELCSLLPELCNDNVLCWFFVHIGLEYLFTIYICYMLYKEYDIVASMRLQFLASQPRRAEQFTVVIRNVPLVSGHSLSDTVDHFFQTNHPDTYLCHQAVYNANKFAKLVRKRDRLRNWLDYNQLKFERHPEKRPTQTVIHSYKLRWYRHCGLIQDFWDFGGKKVDAIEYYNQQIKDFEKKMSLERQKILKNSKSVLPVTFVSFKSRWGAAVCAQTQQSKNPTLWKFIKSFLQGFLPGLALKIFLYILPTVLMIMSKIEGHIAVSNLERRTSAKYYYFMLVNVFLGSIIAGTAFEQLHSFLHQSPTQIPRTIGVSIPMKATFFITYIMVDGWAGIASEILRLKPLVIFHLKNMFIVKTERDREMAMDPGSVDFPETLPSLQLYFLLGIVYAVVTPILLPFMLVFFALAYLVYRHQIINVYNQQYESAGAFWPHVHSRIIASLLISQLLLLGLLSTKEAANSTPLLIVLPILTLAFHKYCKRRFEPAFRKYPLEEAMAKDIMERTTEPELNLKAYLADAYLHPIFHSFQSFQEEEEKVEVRVDKHQVHTASPLNSEPSSPSPTHHVYHPPTSPPQYIYHHSSLPDYIYPPPPPPHYPYHYES
ncbi:hypothetical protein Pint_03539 [Pistacia integerrima]|uniref:Uncharacterized protein n=1 Tax=Pistacia integerrima TaxID=434235 RepID=A0ACC0ZLF1_9ROSI|nr:hypothetical protein Pint_03539 [Pistacia integerrima]